MAFTSHQKGSIPSSRPQARNSRLGMLPLVNWRDSPKKPVLSAHNSIMFGHSRAIKIPPLGHKFTLLRSPPEQYAILSQWTSFPIPPQKAMSSAQMEILEMSCLLGSLSPIAIVSSAPTACCSLLLERPKKEVLGEDNRPKSPGSLMSGKELQREKSSDIPSRSSSSLVSTSSRPCKRKIPLPLFLLLPGLRSPLPLTRDREPVSPSRGWKKLWIQIRGRGLSGAAPSPPRGGGRR
ncbi:uncharacterized protein [Physeter macrocephalus]|uniref:Uncharacterized protein n=1 Tax=Physeter macrocephalus TaxID=9755 RepID=A0A455B0Q5_PHYMC|nr:uncharacterized protein LOC102977811 [Physeter catodon]|eukprot:XP_028342352.1 uncharacterized protein LOC102977811 [Physeter catodon]